MGNLLALFVFDLMDDALREVAVIAKERRLDDVQSQLEAEQQMHGRQLLQSNIDESLMAIIPDPSQRDTIDWKMLLYATIYCHLSVLPSETRRKGIVTNDTSCVLDLFSVKDSEAVSRDMLAKEASVYTQSNECDTMRLVYEASDKDPRRLDCDQQLHIDFKEYFYVSHEDGWRHVIVPNQAEHAEYGKSASDDMAATEMKPIRSPAAIAVCLVWCSWNKCPPGHVNLAALESGNATIEINEQKVTTWTRFHSNGPECVLMGHSNGRYWTPNHSGRFVIRARVDATPQAFLRATSFIVWDNESYHDSNR
jgi:hypothetical protein